MKFMIIFFVVVTILWTLYKQFQGKRVVGKKITILDPVAEYFVDFGVVQALK